MKKNNYLHISLLIILGFTLFMAGCSSSSSSESSQLTDTKDNPTETNVINLKLAHFAPAVHPIETVIVQGWAKRVEEATNGRVKVTSYPGETLLKAAETYDGVVNGIADIGIAPFGYTRGRFPLIEIFDLPGFDYKNAKVASRVAWEAVKEINPEEARDFKPLFLFSTGPGHLLTKEPVRNLEDLRKMKIRVTGLSTKTMELLGVTPVALSQAETYEALTKGLVDGNLAPTEVLKSWKQAEVVKYITLTPFLYTSAFYFAMNNDVWNSLPADMQTAIEEVTEQFFEEEAAGMFEDLSAEGMKYGVEEKGMEVITLSADETAKWKELLKPMHDDYVGQMESKGLPGAEMLELVKDLTAKYNEKY